MRQPSAATASRTRRESLPSAAAQSSRSAAPGRATVAQEIPAVRDLRKLYGFLPSTASSLACRRAAFLPDPPTPTSMRLVRVSPDLPPHLPALPTAPTYS